MLLPSRAVLRAVMLGERGEGREGSEESGGGEGREGRRGCDDQYAHAYVWYQTGGWWPTFSMHTHTLYTFSMHTHALHTLSVHTHTLYSLSMHTHALHTLVCTHIRWVSF